MFHLNAAIPLVLPNNCTWDHITGRYNKNPEDQRRMLVPQESTLNELRKVKGPVCVVAVTGPCRNGKSFILGEVFGHSEVFALGHTMKPETMGIWMWILPEKIRDKNGREITIILLDSEGIDSVESEASSDHRIFTLSCLLSSILLYNSVGVPKMKDLNDLECVTHLSQRIQLKAGTRNKDEAHYASKVLPFFIWLLRDVTLAIPNGHASFKDYLLSEVLNKDNRNHTESARKAAENILGYFPDFDALAFPPPSYEPSVVQNLSDPNVRDRINPLFLSTIEEFRTQVLFPSLCPKRSSNEGEWVTGEGLAALVQLFVQALNIPGNVPNFQNTWDIFVETTCGEAVKESIEMYKVEMASRVKNKIPCDADMLRLANEEVMQKCVQNFLTKTASLSTNSIKEFQEDLEVKASSIFEEYIRQNKEQTTAGCRDLLKNLKKEKWQPILIRLRGPSASKMEFKEVVEAYDAVKNEYQSKAKGAKDMIQDVFMEFLPEFKKEMEQNHDILKLMKGYDADIKNQKAMNAAIEKVQKENEERIAMMEDQMRAKQRQLADLTNKIKEDQIKLQEELAKKELENKNQMKNMVAAHQDQMRESRDRFQKQQENLETRLQGMEKALRDKDQEIKILTSKTDECKSRSIGSLLAEAGVKIVEKVVDKCCVS